MVAGGGGGVSVGDWVGGGGGGVGGGGGGGGACMRVGGSAVILDWPGFRSYGQAQQVSTRFELMCTTPTLLVVCIGGCWPPLVY